MCDVRSIRHGVWREIEFTVDFDLYRLDSLVGPAVRPDDMPAGIGLIARDGHAKPVGQGHDLLDESFARAVAEAITDDDSRPLPRLTLGNGGPARTSVVYGQWLSVR